MPTNAPTTSWTPTATASPSRSETPTGSEALTEKQKARRVKAIYRRWLEDEKFFEEISVRPESEFGDVQEVLRNLGSAIAYAQAYVNKRTAR